MEKIRTQKQAGRYANVSDRTIRRWQTEGWLEKEHGEYSREQLDHCKQRHRKGFIKTDPEDVRQLRQEVDVAIDILTNIRTKLNQLLTWPGKKGIK